MWTLDRHIIGWERRSLLTYVAPVYHSKAVDLEGLDTA